MLKKGRVFHDNFVFAHFKKFERKKGYESFVRNLQGLQSPRFCRSKSTVNDLM